MQLFTSRTVFATTLVVGLAVVSLATRANEPALPMIPVAPPVAVPPPVPTAPTVPPPVPPADRHVRYQNLLPAPGKAADDKDKNGEEKKNGDEMPPPDTTKIVEVGPELSLGQCIEIALERQPSLRAVKASMAATEAGYRALIKFGTVGTLLSPDLDIRKQQAQRALAASSGEYQKAHNEVVQDVTRMYYTVVYAKQQEAITTDVVEYLGELVDLVKELLNSKLPPAELGGLNYGKLRVMEIGLSDAKLLRLTARAGHKQAMAALRQVMAVDDRTFPFRVKDAQLPVMAQQAAITKDLVVDLAVGRRPELALAAAGVDAFRLEVYAQGKIPFRRVVPTLASGADIHAKEIPQAQRGKEYRPGGIIPEMPTQLVGSKFDRVCRAMAFSQKADAIFESARGLIMLEAEIAFIEFEQASERLKLAKEKLTAGLDLQKRTVESAENIKAKDVLVQAYVAAAKAQADYVEAVFQHLQALANLERVTAGGIRPAFPGR